MPAWPNDVALLLICETGILIRLHRRHGHLVRTESMDVRDVVKFDGVQTSSKPLGHLESVPAFHFTSVTLENWSVWWSQFGEILHVIGQLSSWEAQSASFI